MGQKNKSDAGHARAQWAGAKAAFDAGNFRVAGVLVHDIIREAPESDMAERALAMQRDLQVDPLAVRIGLAALLALLLSWVAVAW